MFENNLDFDLDENVFSDDFLPNEDKIPKATNRIGNEQKASNLFKQPPIPPDRVQQVLTNIKVNTRRKSEKRVVQRKFPGPAGLLPEILNDSNNKDNSFHEPGGVSNDVDDMLMCSQASLSMFQEEPWTTMRLDFKAESNYTIEWIKSNATGKTLVNQKAPFLAAVIKSIECATKLKMPTLTLKDPTDEIQADISHDLYEEHANDLTVGSVIVLRQFSVFSVKNENVHHLTITSNNLVAVYNKERQSRLNFENRKLNRDSPSYSARADANKCKKLSDASRLELDALRSYAHQNIRSAEKINPCRDKNEAAGKQSECRSSLELVQKIRDLKAMSESKNSFNSLIGMSTSKFKFRAHPNLNPNEVDDLNLSLDLFSEEFLTDSPSEITSSNLDELKTRVSPDTQNNSLKNKLCIDEESPPLKKPKTTLSQKFREFKPRDEPEPSPKANKDDVVCKSDSKGSGNFIDCSQISVVSQNKEDQEILEDVLHNVDAESLFEDF